MRKLSQGLLFFGGLLALPSSTHIASPAPPQSLLENDPRLGRLRDFLEGTPVQDHAEDFILAADRNDLDWRLLPSISMIESSGGKNCRNNNIFGWDCGREAFPSVRTGIQYVANRLANSKLYKNKDLDSLLFTYNPITDYPFRVKRLMRTLGPTSLALTPASPRPVSYSSIRTPK